MGVCELCSYEVKDKDGIVEKKRVKGKWIPVPKVEFKWVLQEDIDVYKGSVLVEGGWWWRRGGERPKIYLCKYFSRSFDEVVDKERA